MKIPEVHIFTMILGSVLSMCSFIVSMIYLCVSFGRSRELRNKLCSVILTLVSFLMTGFLVYLNIGSSHGENEKWKLELGEILVVAASLVILAVTVIFVVTDNRKHKDEINNNSIRESFDVLPTGVGFFSMNGMPILVNMRMELICESLTGAGLINGNKFWAFLNEDIADRLDESFPKPTVRLSDGTVWYFSLNEIETETDKCYEMTAYDVTALSQIGAKLTEENAHLEAMNSRLKKYSEDVSDLTREEEILSAKIKIHDELGQIILATRHFVSEGMPENEREKLLESWKINLSLLTNEAEPVKQADAKKVIIDAGKAIGIDIVTEGAFPVSKANIMHVIYSAARECMTNAVSHAKADKMLIKGEIKDGYAKVTVTNNGIIPESAIQEGGGLSGLRRSVEKLGGLMQINLNPEFELILELPMEGEISYD